MVMMLVVFDALARWIGGKGTSQKYIKACYVEVGCDDGPRSTMSMPGSTTRCHTLVA